MHILIGNTEKSKFVRLGNRFVYWYTFNVQTVQPHSLIY